MQDKFGAVQVDEEGDGTANELEPLISDRTGAQNGFVGIINIIIIDCRLNNYMIFFIYSTVFLLLKFSPCAVHRCSVDLIHDSSLTVIMWSNTATLWFLDVMLK